MKTKLNTLSKSLIIAGVIGAVSLPAAANKYRDFNNSAFDHAKVVGVEPLYESYQVNDPVEQCWDERVPRQTRHNNRRGEYSRTPEILGGIIGAALGNRFGHGDGRKIATVAGAVLGASVGRDVKRQNRNRHGNRHADKRYDRGYENANYEVVQRCEVRDNYTTKQQLVGYDVAYKYRGNVFHTQMDQRPGDKIKVKVTVNPV